MILLASGLLMVGVWALEAALFSFLIEFELVMMRVEGDGELDADAAILLGCDSSWLVGD